ncbi:hypothetical protein ANTQUA_LOCUS4993 [Anthophora quadrimaculata]
MKELTCFWVSLLCYILCIKCGTIFVHTLTVNPIVTVNENSRENWKLLRRPVDLEIEEERRWDDFIRDSTKAKVFKKSTDSRDEEAILFSTDKCSRYCIRRNFNENEDNFQYIKLFWTANGTDDIDHPLTKDYLQLLPEPEWTYPENPNTSRNCQIYLDLNCDTVEVETTSNNTKRIFDSNMKNNEQKKDDPIITIKPSLKIPIKIAEKYNLSEQTQTKFLVDTKILEITINVDGNVLNAELQIPMTSRHRTAISWIRKSDTNGVRIETRNAPPGEWRIKLLGEDDSKYHFTAEGFIDENKHLGRLFHPDSRLNGSSNGVTITNYRTNTKTINELFADKKENFNDDTIHPQIIVDNEENSIAKIGSKLVENNKITRERLLIYDIQNQGQNERTRKRSSNNDSSMIFSGNENVLTNTVDYVTTVDNEKNLITSRNNSSEKSSETILSTKEKLNARSLSELVENFDVNVRPPPIKENVNISMRMIETQNNQELSEEFVNSNNENTIEEKKMLIEVNKDSNLLAMPGTIHRIVFDVMNSCILPVRYAFRVKSTPFRLYNIEPTYAWIYPGQMNNVAVDLVVPDNAAPDTANKVTLSILGTEIKEKSVFLYVQGSLSKLIDDVKPTIKYFFNNNCAGHMGKEECYKTRWSVDITIEDYESGLKRVISSPNDIYARTEFISGTRSPVTFYYSATCCDKTAKITAIDLLNNYNTHNIDVTAWNNLSEAEIAAITVGALFILLLIILVIVIIVYYIRKRKSHDLPYTQRYGSRPPSQSERTNF